MMDDRDIREKRPCCIPRSKRIMAIFDEGYLAQSKSRKGVKMGRTNHLDVYLHLTDSKPGHKNSMKVRMSPITRKLRDVLCLQNSHP